MSRDKTLTISSSSLPTYFVDDGAHLLVALDGSERKVEVRPGESLVLGRGSEADVLLDAPSVSRRHCSVVLDGDDIAVEDLGSSNGTYVEAEPIRGRGALRPGQVLRLGSLPMRHEVWSRDELERRDLVSRDLDHAAGYVRRLLPPPIDESGVRTSSIFVPSAKLGGDALGCHWLEPGRRLAVALIDVCGHGTASALHAVTVLNVLKHRTDRVDFADPAQVLTRLNDLYPMDRFGNLFFTLWYGVLDVPSRRLTYATAGHPPAFLFDSPDSCRQLATPNPPVGMQAGRTYVGETVQLGPGGRLYVYSDGAYELEQSEGHDLGIEGLEAICGRDWAEIVDEPSRVEAAVKQWAEQTTLEDDLSILVLEID